MPTTTSALWPTASAMVWAKALRLTLHSTALLAAACTLAPNAAAQSRGIYTCVDGAGNRLTADRPIPACLDREQRELNPSGTVKRNVPPVPTALERAQQAERERLAELARSQRNRERQLEQALALRYPTAAAHDKEREATLAQTDERIRLAQARLGDLAKQRTVAELELEFYKSDPSKAPAALKRQLVDIDNSTAAQKRFVAEQEAEKLRLQQRFDEERVRLRTLWAKESPPPATAASGPAGSSQNGPQP